MPSLPSAFGICYFENLKSNIQMDQIAKLNSTVISRTIQPTFEILVPLLIANESRILSVPRKTYSYGTHPRQTLDLYLPTTASTSPSPILIFFYGGGLTRGDRILPHVPHSLIYHNLGAFFALRNITTLIPDYRRVDDPETSTGEGATFPSGGEDIAAVLDWLQSASCPLPSSDERRDVFLVGNSAGGVHVATYLFAQQFESERKQLFDGSSTYRLCGAVLMSVSLDFKDARLERAATLERYWPANLSGESSSQSQEKFCPNGLLRSLNQRIVNGELARRGDSGIPDLLVLLGEFDPEDEILEPGMRFCDLWGDVSGGETAMEIKWIKGHNHISPPLALMGGDSIAERWGEEVMEWMNKTIKRVCEKT